LWPAAPPVTRAPESTAELYAETDLCAQRPLPQGAREPETYGHQTEGDVTRHPNRAGRGTFPMPLAARTTDLAVEAAAGLPREY